MRWRQLLKNTTQTLMWLSYTFAACVGAVLAAKHAALGFYYYYGQHCIFEPVVRSETPQIDPAHEGKLVRIYGYTEEHPHQPTLPEGGVCVERHTPDGTTKYYTVRSLGLGIKRAHLGRQQGHKLISTEEEAWRLSFSDKHPQLSLLKTLWNSAFLTLIATLGFALAWYTLHRAAGRRSQSAKVFRLAIYTSLLVSLIVGSTLPSKGVLINNPGLEYDRSPASLRTYAQGHFPPERVAAAEQWIWGAIALCLLLAVAGKTLPPLLRRTKKH